MNLDDLKSIGGSDGGGGLLDVAEPDVSPPATCKSATTQCVLAAPAGWAGPLAIYDGPEGQAPSSCPSPEVQLLGAFDVLTVPAATCDPCSCTSANAACASVNVNPFNDPNCTTTACAAITVPPNTCEELLSLTKCGGAAIALAPNVTGTCTASGGAATIPKATWSSVVLGCKEPSSALVQSDCSSDQVCMPTPAAPFEAHACIVQDGDVACPGLPYLNKRTVYNGIADTRACSTCGCSMGTAKCTGGVAYAGSNAGCMGSQSLVPFGQCVDFGNGPNWKISATLPANSCTADGGTLSGSATGATPTTLCCTN